MSSLWDTPRVDIRHLIAEKRDGKRHSPEGFKYLAEAAAACDLAKADGGGVPPYQLSAWLMAAYLTGLDKDETAGLTLAMADSGQRLDLVGLPHPWVDKHSTGGVGDKTTIALLPILAASGLTVVKMSGKGLGITGGTVDKLSSIPGFRLDLTPDEMVAQAKEIGLAITGQTPNLAPADKTLYALRDATETVASVPLIVSSILSKKLAGGAEILGLDVKCGSGAFMKTLSEAKELSSWLLDVAKRCGLSTHVTITDMDQPLGRCAGNALEVREAIELLAGSPSGRFGELVLHLAGETLAAVGKVDSFESGIGVATASVTSGRAQAKARQWIEAQGGDPALLDNPDRLQAATNLDVLKASRAGWIARVDAGSVGRAVLSLGGGRQAATDKIDLAVGVETLVEVGQEVKSGVPLFHLHSNDPARLAVARATLQTAIEYSDTPVSARPIILETLT